MMSIEYKITRHAIERTAERLGIEASQAESHIKQLMQTAHLQGITANKDGGTNRIYDHHASNTRIITCSDGETVITLYRMPERDIKANDFRFLKGALTREIRKLRREYTSKIRQTERQLAKEYAKLSEQLSNYANARNPNTRELIGERMANTERIISGTRQAIERMKDEMQARIKAIEVISE